MAEDGFAALDHADVVDARVGTERGMRLPNVRVPLLSLFADLQQAHLRLGASHDLPRLDRPEVGEVEEFLGGAIDIRAGIEDEDVAVRRRE